MYNRLREKVNLLLEDNCEFQTAQESFNKPKQERTAGVFSVNKLKNEFDDFGTDENYVRIAKQILKKQKKLGKLKSVKVQVLSLDESRKKRLKSAGILMGTTIGLSALAGTLDYAARKKSVDYLANKKLNGKTNGAVKEVHSFLRKDSAKKMGATTAVMAGLSGASLALSKNNHELVIICDYEYGKRILPLFELTEKVNTKKAISTIGSNVTKAVKKLQKAQEWAVKEDFSQLDFSKKYMTELLIESMEE